MSAAENNPQYQLLLKKALNSIGEVNDIIDELLSSTRTARTPGQDYLVFAERIAETALGIRATIKPARQPVVIAVLLERLLDQEALDKGVPK